MQKTQEHTFPTIEIVPLGTAFLRAPLLSDQLITHIQERISKQEKVLIFYNRRGSGRAFICQDCGYFPRCPHCDIALSHHTSPKNILLCHHCNYIENHSLLCPNCQGSRFQSIGIGIQKIEQDLSGFFPNVLMTRIDSDIEMKKKELLQKVQSSDIVLSTYSNIAFIHQDIAEVIFLLFESDLTLPDYRIEEESYHTIDYIKKSEKSILIQTYTPDHPLLHIISEGNYKDFLGYITPERKKFLYPPYAQFALLRIHDISKDRLTNIIEKIVNKIEILKKDSTFLAYDRDIWERYRGEWVQKIILKDIDLSYILIELEVEIVKNRAVTLEYR